MDCLDQDLNRFFNVYQNMKPQPQGHALDNPYQKGLKPDFSLDNKPRSPSQYQYGDKMTYSEKEALKQLQEASSWPKFYVTGEYDHMELIDYIDGLFIDVPRIPDYWITAMVNTEFKGHASIWYTKMKEIYGRRNWPWWKSQIIQKYSNCTWIWQKTICHQSCTLDEIANTLQDVRERTKLGKYSQDKSSNFKEKQPFGVDFKDKTKGRVAEVTKKKSSCDNCGSTDHYSNNSPKEKKKVYSIEQVPEEESTTEDSEPYSMGNAIREQSYEDQDPREKFLVEYQEEKQLEIQDIQLEAGIPQKTENINLCKHTQDEKTFLVTPT
ncbi:hypothetical protein O181_016471 [Austropuccinia psidii MF-1]|uniref:Uncharacterized protein n=1 Tax=Austropuccinia psidii MF-1 TaxID=1389203 RepID=A0A9Q3GR27_9BASI|nr:hypothetical protein [Austropuccinia psidii MF-1]